MIDFKISEASENTKYDQVKDSIVAAIRDGRLAPLSKLPPISQIAADAGVSLRTADLALQALISEGFCFRRPKKGTFVAAGKRVRKQPICGVLGRLDPVNFPLHSLLYAGVMEASIRRNVPTLTLPLPTGKNAPGGPNQMIRNCDRGQEFDLRGVFIADRDCYHYGIELAKAFPKKRFFMLNYEMDDFGKMPANMAAVINDNYAGACRLASRIFGQFRPKTVSFLGHSLSNGDITYLERERGIRDTAKKAGVKVTATITNEVSGNRADQIDFAYEAVLKFLKKKKTDFIFAANDFLAFGAKKAVGELELNGKTGVAGYDGINLPLEQDFPTVRVPYTEMGRTALEEMLDPEFRMPQIIKLQPEIIMHGKTGGKLIK